MALRLYNTLTKEEEEFVPAHDGEVTMYTCGPTVYGRAHVGNLSSFLMADLLRRWLQYGHGYSVKHVKNITDVGHLVADADTGEDKVEKAARVIAEERRGAGAAVTHDDVIAVAETHTKTYLEDEAKLGFMEPFARPRASQYVEQMKEMITALLHDGHAYATADGIYFDVTSPLHTPYGALSGNKLDELNAGARVDVNEQKKHPADFALWKFCVGHNEHHVLRWPSPVGAQGETYPEGFPGWHIECSAMSRALLGDTIDIHTGGEDNIFPHHECEIAQSESVTHEPFVRFWMHRRRIQLGEEKMSKSLGNVLNLDDILAKGFSAEELRYYLLSVHYRTQLKFTEEGLQGASKERSRIIAWFADVRARCANAGLDYASLAASNAPCPALDALHDAMDSDLNVPGARAVIFDGLTNYYKYLEGGGVLEAHDYPELCTFIDLVEKTFGCFTQQTVVISPDLQAILDARAQARVQKNFAESDRLRAELNARGFDVKDTKDGQQLSKM